MLRLHFYIFFLLHLLWPCSFCKHYVLIWFYSPKNVFRNIRSEIIVPQIIDEVSRGFSHIFTISAKDCTVLYIAINITSADRFRQLMLVFISSHRVIWECLRQQKSPSNLPWGMAMVNYIAFLLQKLVRTYSILGLSQRTCDH